MRQWTVSLEWETVSPLTSEQLNRASDIGGLAGGEIGSHWIGSTVTLAADREEDAVAELSARMAEVVPGAPANVKVRAARSANGEAGLRPLGLP
ncbi:MAG TPA: hypothetical protein VMB82_10370 [Acidimicrobiales bacterium]|nr:hypothetical protein [Acidimicrobiales bacterium]